MTIVGKTVTLLVFLMSVLFLAFSTVVFWNHDDLQTEAVEVLTPRLNKINEEINSLTVETAELMEAVAHEKEAHRTALVALEMRSIQTREALKQKGLTVDQLDVELRQRIRELTAIQAELKALVGQIAAIETEINATKLVNAREFAKVVELTSEIHEAVGAHRRLSERRMQLERQIQTIEDGLPAAGASEFSTKTAVHSAPGS